MDFFWKQGGELKCLDQAKDPRTTMTPTTTEVIPRSLVFGLRPQTKK